MAATDHADAGHCNSDSGHDVIFTVVFVFLRSSAGSSGAVRIQPTIAGEGHNWLR